MSLGKDVDGSGYAILRKDEALQEVATAGVGKDCSDRLCDRLGWVS